MSCAIAIEETALHALVTGTLSNVTVPVGIEVGSVAIEAFGVTGIVVDGVPIGLVGMTGVVSGQGTFYLFILAL
jgi:hypothetical protein